MADSNKAPDDQAMRRVMLLTLIRLAGFAVILGGFAVAGTAHGTNIRMTVGIAVATIGLAIFLLLPRRLARKWAA